MPEQKDDAVEFKVVDRRQFTSDGQKRPDAPPPAPVVAEVPVAKSTPPQPPPVAKAPQPTPPAAQESPAKEVPGSVQFEHLIMSLVSSAMYHLGLATRPGEVARPPDLPAAQETIELLGILQQKTKGNLSKEEEHLLTNGLYELRMVYVELTRNTMRSR